MVQSNKGIYNIQLESQISVCLPYSSKHPIETAAAISTLLVGYTFVCIPLETTGDKKKKTTQSKKQLKRSFIFNTFFILNNAFVPKENQFT